MSTETSHDQRPNRREAILDAAEALCAQRGLDAVSIRNIADAAAVKLSLVTYHFPSKDQLFAEVLSRRSEVLSSARRDKLNAMRTEDGFDLPTLVDCYTRPMLDMSLMDDIGWRNYVHLIAQVAQSYKYSESTADLYADTATIFVDALMELYPKASKENAIRSWVYLVSVKLGVFSYNGRVEVLSEGQFSSNPGDAYESMLKFIVGGVDALMRASA